LEMKRPMPASRRHPGWCHRDSVYELCKTLTKSPIGADRLMMLSLNPWKSGTATALVGGKKMHISSCPDFHTTSPSVRVRSRQEPDPGSGVLPGSELESRSSYQGIMVLSRSIEVLQPRTCGPDQGEQP
jgi:hypothetical protein